jgi:hypothetical protein
MSALEHAQASAAAAASFMSAYGKELSPEEKGVFKDQSPFCCQH